MWRVICWVVLITSSLLCDEGPGCEAPGAEAAADLASMSRLLDLERYPLHAEASPAYTELVEWCRQQLASLGSVDLPGFIRSSVLAEMTQEVSDLPSYNRLNVVSAYGAALDDEPKEVNQTMPRWRGQDHPAKRKFAQDVFAVAGDLVPSSALIRKVYDSPMVMRFLAKASGKQRMFQMDDEFQCINIMYMYDGCSRAWHYDGTDTVITILLQKPDQGGEYEFAPFIRGKERGEENFEEVARLFDGSYENKIVKDAEAGTLNLFNGMRSLHRVRTVYGPTKRVISILSYHTEPGLRGAVLKNVKLYGERVATIYRGRGLL